MEVANKLGNVSEDIIRPTGKEKITTAFWKHYSQ